MNYSQLMVLLLIMLSGYSAVVKAEHGPKSAWQWLDHSAQGYQFEQLALHSEDKKRHYQLTVATPEGGAPAEGYPVLYMLDGNTALAALNDPFLSGLPNQKRPVIVMIGYEREAQEARAFDYTPATGATSASYGGAEQFWHFLEHKVKPLVAHRVPLDKQQQSLWGHSYGGLFVLYTLFHHPNSFQTYTAADPSLWWEEGALLKEVNRYYDLPQRPAGQLLIQHSASHRTGSVLPNDASRRLAEQLSQLSELKVQYHDFFAHHHGSVRAASIPAALRLAVGIQ